MSEYYDNMRYVLEMKLKSIEAKAKASKERIDGFIELAKIKTEAFKEIARVKAEAAKTRTEHEFKYLETKNVDKTSFMRETDTNYILGRDQKLQNDKELVMNKPSSQKKAEEDAFNEDLAIVANHLVAASEDIYQYQAKWIKHQGSPGDLVLYKVYNKQTALEYVNSKRHMLNWSMESRIIPAQWVYIPMPFKPVDVIDYTPNTDEISKYVRSIATMPSKAFKDAQNARKKELGS